MHASVFFHCSKSWDVTGDHFLTLFFATNTIQGFFHPFKKLFQEPIFFTSSCRPTILQNGLKMKQWSSPFPNGAKRFYNVHSNNQVHDFKGSRGSKRQILNRKNAAAVVWFGSIFAATVYYGHWQIVPYTNRAHFVLYSRSHAKEYGELDSQRIKAKFQGNILPPLHPQNLRVQQIARDLIQTYQKGVSKSNDDLKWEVFLVDKPAINDHNYAGANIVLSTGLLNHFKEDAEIATIIGHEFGHVVAGHNMERYSKVMYITVIWQFVLYLFLESPIANKVPFFLKFLRLPFLVRSFIYAIIYGVTWFGVCRQLMKIYIRRMDLEADYIGLLLLASAGYDPLFTLLVRAKMIRMGRGGLEWENTRIRRLALDMEEAFSIRREVHARRGIRGLELSKMARPDFSQ